MNNTMDLSTSDQLDRLSAFCDGELSESELNFVLDSLDERCCAENKSYQIIGDVMRDSSLAISKALDAEPAHSLDAAEEQDTFQATGTYGAVSGVSPKGQIAQVHRMPGKPKARLAFVAGGVAAAFATIVTFHIFQSNEIQPGLDSTVPVLASAEVQPVVPVDTPEVTIESPVLAATAVSNAADSSQSFSRSPTVAVRASATNSRVSTEERRRTYPEYLRSHSDMSAHTPFMQVNYQVLGAGQ